MTQANVDQAILSGHEVTGIGLVVSDVAATARRYAQLFGVASWCFYDFELGRGDEVIRVGSARIGRLDLELVQPLAGEGSHSRFRAAHGSGIHHVSFGPVDDCDGLVERFAAKGVEIDMQAGLGNGSRFTYLDTQEAVATRFELVDPGTRAPTPWGRFEADSAGASDLSGRELVQLGIVVDDVERVAASYSELLGVADWNFVEFEMPDDWPGIFQGMPAPGARAHIKAALADHGALQIELLEPVSGTSTHMDFLRRHGPGIHHLSFGAIEDHDAVLEALQGQGIVVEMGGPLGPGIRFSYLQTQESLGTIFEIVGTSS
jgi:catechol 2,3-dioxygenase-like lactoylglutathione lyase family enzyme